MPDVIIADTSCLILLMKIGKLEILKKLYSKVFITDEVAKEFGVALPVWIKIKKLSNKNSLTILKLDLGIGEASSIALAIELENSFLILDDLRARKCAKKLGLKFTGTLGVIAEAFSNGYIKSVKAVLNQIKKTDFRLSAELEKKLLSLEKN